MQRALYDTRPEIRAIRAGRNISRFIAIYISDKGVPFLRKEIVDPGILGGRQDIDHIYIGILGSGGYYTGGSESIIGIKRILLIEIIHIPGILTDRLARPQYTCSAGTEYFGNIGRRIKTGNL